MEYLICSLGGLVVLAGLVIGAFQSRKRSKSFAREYTRGLERHANAVREAAPASAHCWVPPGAEAKVGKRRIPGGMVYVGEQLSELRGWGGVEPALIDPSLPRDDARPDRTGEGMSYWPNYARIPPAARSGYLDWLAEGRSDPGAYVGFVFLFFYGLERRALHDAEHDADARSELPAIGAEVERLLGLYGANRSFHGYASGFLDVLRAHALGVDASAPPADAARRTELPFALRAAVGRMAVKGEPLPADWALAWARADPEIALRTPAGRCPEEFDLLFRRAYTARHKDGIKLKPCKRTVRLEYQPASASFGGPVRVDTDVPDVTSLVGPRRKLAALAAECADALDSYSRWVGKHPERRGELAAAALLPELLLDDLAPASFGELRDKLAARLDDEGHAAFAAAEVLAPWLPAEGLQTKKAAVEAARLFARAGFGVEPDVRFGGRRLARDDRVVVFRLGEGEHETPTPAYAAATVLLHLAAMVSTADGEVSPEEEERLSEHLAASLYLDDAEQRRLAAHLAWLLEAPPGTAGVKKRIEGLSKAQRQDAGRFLVQVAWAGGRVEPDEVKSLTKIFRLLGLDPGAVHGWLHEVAAGEPAAEPVRVRPAEPAAGFAVPEPPAAEPAALDMEAVRNKLDETAAVASMLAGIFADEEEEPAEPAEGAEPAVAGLDSPHSALLRKLGDKPEWTLAEFSELSESLGLMPAGALDVLNEAAFEACDEPLTDGTDPIVIDTDVYREILA